MSDYKMKLKKIKNLTKNYVSGKKINTDYDIYINTVKVGQLKGNFSGGFSIKDCENNPIYYNDDISTKGKKRKKLKQIAIQLYDKVI